MLSTEVYNISTGMTIAIIFEFIVLIYHANTNKKEKFIMWWALGMGLTVVGLLSVHIGDSEPLYKLSLILSNAFTILGQGAFFVSIEIYLNKSFLELEEQVFEEFGYSKMTIVENIKEIDLVEMRRRI